jgi:hypothetical protein
MLHAYTSYQMRQVKNTYLICLGIIKQTQQVYNKKVSGCRAGSLHGKVSERIVLVIIAVLAEQSAQLGYHQKHVKLMQGGFYLHSKVNMKFLIRPGA